MISRFRVLECLDKKLKSLNPYDSITFWYGSKDFRFDFSLGFQSSNDILVFPADFVGDTAQFAELKLMPPENYSSSWFQFNNAESGRYYQSLHFVVWSWNTLEAFESLKSLFASLGLVWHHASDCSGKNFARSSELTWSIDLMITFISVETSRNIYVFASYNGDFLSLQNTFGYHGSKSAEQVPASVNN
ncbi:hypothetical protein BpHYR1_045286 [Brachionus plicatilis]|uniref:Uncharacterized protein n=1 Tax=Brachionus plicatilis TaxID=10195 RepID=A0A3M7SN35_BRAPC|nr:hypothetical protein BpHYR1_045286 [Brachionus plicatilis]